MEVEVAHSGFSKMHKIDNNTIIANFVFLVIAVFLFMDTNICNISEIKCQLV